MFETTALDSVAGHYVDKNVGTSTPGTRLEADDRNIIQDELVNLVEGKGLTLDPTGVNRDQILEAVDIAGLTAKNAIINGAMLHAQRGASGSAVFNSTTTPANSNDAYLLDRWLLLSHGNNIVDVSQSTDAPTGSLLSCALDVETVNLKFGLLQIIEQKNCQHMIGGNVSLSFEARVTDIAKLDNIKAMILSWDGAADAPMSDIISIWGAEDTTPTLVANWTAENTPANLSVTATWAKYKIENVAIDTAATKNIGVFIWSDGFCDTLGKILRITNVQLEKNSIATDFEWRNVATELALCQRYYCKSHNQNIAPGTASVNGRSFLLVEDCTSSASDVYLSSHFPIIMRNDPTVYSYDDGGIINQVTMQSGGVVSVVGQQGMYGVSIGGTNGGASVDRELSYQYVAEIEL